MLVENDELRLIVREVVRAEIIPITERLDAKDRDAAEERARVDGLSSAYHRLSDQLAEHGKLLADQATAITSVAKSAATAAELATAAIQASSRTQDDLVKMVASAMKIHNEQIGNTVSATIRRELEPRVVSLEEENRAQNATLTSLEKNDEAQNIKLAEILNVVTKLLGNRWVRGGLILGSIVGSAAAGFLARYVAH